MYIVESGIKYQSHLAISAPVMIKKREIANKIKIMSHHQTRRTYQKFNHKIA
jgi:hypothetical protein